MRLPPERPISLALAFALIRAASPLVPDAQQAQYQYEWQQKLFHRWQFLHQTSLWNVTEEVKLLWGALPALPEAIQHFGAQDQVRSWVRRVIQSPLTCLGMLAALFLLIAIWSGGFPATRDLFFKRIDSAGSHRVFVWSHNLRGGGDRPIPADVVEGWKTHSRLATSVAAFRAVHREIKIGNRPATRSLVVITEPGFFSTVGIQPQIWREKAVSGDYVLLSDNAWMELFHASPRIDTPITISEKSYPIRGVLPAGFEPLSRQAAVYLVEPKYSEKDAYAVLRVNNGVSERALDKEFLEVAQNVTYYLLNGQLRFGFAQAAVWAPVRSFVFGVLASVLMLFLVFRFRWITLRRLPAGRQRIALLLRSGFFLAKTSLGLLCVFTLCLEWSRSDSAILFGNFDPASGPFLLWLYILGSMGILFAAVADQRARCRQCLQLLAFPVRMGSPGTMLLDWSGIELCCTQGHGVLHVPHLAPSWADESEHWIALDDSWQGIFGSDRRNF